MAFSDNKITSADLIGKGVTGMADTPNLTTAQMQQKLDELPKEVIVPKFNALCDDLDETDFASIITSKSTDKMLYQRLNEYDQIEYSVDNVNWSLIASGKEILDPTLEADNSKKLGGQLPSYYQKTTDDTLNTTDKTTTGAINEINTALGNVDTTANEAPTYNATLTYAVGDYVSYEKHIYKCNTAIETAEEWNASHWTQVTLGAEIETVNNSLGDVSDITSTTYSDIVKLIQYWQLQGELSDPTLQALIPVMTSNTAPSGIASAVSSYSGKEPYFAFDGNDSTFWMSNTQSVPIYLTYKFANAVAAKRVNCKVLYDQTTYVSSMTFKIRGSNDGTNWTDLCASTTKSFTSSNNYFNINLSNSTEYLYYQIYITDEICTGSSYKGHIVSLQLYANS